MQPRNRRRRATALVITVGLLAVLAVIGFGFAVLMKLNVDASASYTAAARIDMLSHAVVMYALRDIRYGWTNEIAGADHTLAGMQDLRSMRAGCAWEPTQNPSCPWYVDPSLASGLDSDRRFCYLKNSSYGMVHDVLGDRIAVSYAKVLDAASKINVNDDYDSTRLATILDYLFDELAVNTAIDQSTPGHTVNALSGADIIAHRATLAPTYRYSTLDQLMLIPPLSSGKSTRMTARRFDVLKHYLTIYSWPHDPPSVSGFQPYSIKPTAAQSLQSDTGKRRSPINVNTAPFEVLVAILRAIRGSDGTTLTTTEARNVAWWILRKRDPENPDPTIAANTIAITATPWQSWLTSDDYQEWIRKHTIRTWPRETAANTAISGWRGYPLGPFDTWNEFFDFVYSLTDGTGTGAGHDPFPTVLTGVNARRKAEAIIAAVCPNTFATCVARNTYAMGYTRLLKARPNHTEFRLRDFNTTDATTPAIRGKNDLSTTGYTPEFCFSSMGRFEFYTRTFAFAKADTGTVTSHSDYTLADSTKAWGTSPAQWRGYSVVIYDGEGKGQLRAIVNNTSQTLTVGKWSKRAGATTPLANNVSRYYILGPGPLLDRMGTDVAFASATPHILRDTGSATEPINWEDGQWNGYRVVVYKVDLTKNPPEIPEDSIQERVIVDTLGGTAKSLVLSPELDPTLLSGSIGYMILGSYGNAVHSAAAKAYDVIHHTSQKDFAPSNSNPTGCSNIAIGPNPLTAGVAIATDKDGFITVQDKDTSDSGTFRINFKLSGLAADAGGSKVAGALGGTAKADDIFLGGNAMNDGLFLRAKTDGSGDWIAYAPAPQLVTSANNEGGYVSLWFRPDINCFDGRPHTIVRIKGDSEASDLKLVMEGTNLRLVCGQGDVTYGTLQVRRATGLQFVPVLYNKTERRPPGVSINVASTSHAAIYSPWKAGEWHHIAFAWYECYDGTIIDEGGGDNKADRLNIETEDPPTLDPNQVIGNLRLWVDGVAVTTPGPNVDAFNLIPDASNAVIQFGEASATAAGTIDGVVARRLTDKNQVISGALAPAITSLERYANVDALYTSPVITLPTGIAGQKVCLGTLAWTGLRPFTPYNLDIWQFNLPRNYPIRITVKLSAPLTVAKEMPANHEYRQPALGGGGPIVSSTGSPIIAPSGSTIQYEVRMTAEHGSTTDGVPPYWQTPYLEDITITYLSPVTFFHWK